MFGLPESTAFDKRIPKQKFYDNAEVSSKLKRYCIDVVQEIIWKNKISAADRGSVGTVALESGDIVSEIEVIEVILSDNKVDIDFLEKLELDYWKIPSGEITNLPYLERISKNKKGIILSTGMCNIDEVMTAVRALERNLSGEIILLHCNTQYPTPYIDVNLNAMNTLRELTGKRVGYSDHTRGIEVPIAAVAMGACVIEKHFTLSCDMQGPDHKASLTPSELRKMVQCIRHIEVALGNGEKKVSDSERENLAIVRKSIVASTNIKSGELFSENNVTTKIPGTGISPMHWHVVLGKKAVRDFKKDEMIEL